MNTKRTDSLTYISSAGLRFLMKFCKSMGKKLSVINVSKEIFEIFDTTGFTNILDVQKKLREISVEGCELLGQGGNGSVYRLDDDKIVKVYKPYMTREVIDKEREFARTAFMNGVPSVTTGAEKAVQLAPILMDKMLRAVVIPNEQALRHILSSAK